VNACFLMRCSLVLQISFSGSRNTFFPHRGMHSPWRWTRQRCVGTPSFLSILVPLQDRKAPLRPGDWMQRCHINFVAASVRHLHACVEK
jgi:hypothetical protein